MDIVFDTDDSFCLWPDLLPSACKRFNVYSNGCFVFNFGQVSDFQKVLFYEFLMSGMVSGLLHILQHDKHQDLSLYDFLYSSACIFLRMGNGISIQNNPGWFRNK